MALHHITRLALSFSLSVLGVLALGDPADVAAQTSAFRSGVDIVPLTVTVTDAAGKYVAGLTGADFAVFEDGVQQSLSFFASGQVPVDVMFVLDTSGSMSADMSLVRDSANGLVRALREGDRGAVVAVNTSVAIPQRLTTDHERIAAAINALAPSGTTAIYDALYIALRELARDRRQHSEVRRQVLVLLSDGLDNASHVSADDVADVARGAGVSIYVIALKGANISISGAPRDLGAARAAYSMRAIARDAGGRIFHPTMATELPAVYGAIARELTSQYDLGYVPTKPGGDGAFRRIAVRVLPPTRAVARTRSGYHAARSDQIDAGQVLRM